MIRILRVTLAALLGVLLWAQTAATPERQAYEKYRLWITKQPVAVQRSEEQWQLYRAELKRQGLSEGDADARIKLILQQGRVLEIERWNEILTASQPRFNTDPNAFLVAMVKGRKPGKALDVGMGQGRNAVWLAQQGWDVTGFDPAERAVALARQNAEKAGVKLKTEIVGSEEFSFGENQWDLIVLSYVGARDVKENVERSLKPGGIVVVEGAHRDATKTQSIGGAVVFDTGELPMLFSQLRSVFYAEPMEVPDFGPKRKWRLVRYCGEKPNAE